MIFETIFEESFAGRVAGTRRAANSLPDRCCNDPLYCAGYAWWKTGRVRRSNSFNDGIDVSVNGTLGGALRWLACPAAWLVHSVASSLDNAPESGFHGCRPRVDEGLVLDIEWASA